MVWVSPFSHVRVPCVNKQALITNRGSDTCAHTHAQLHTHKRTQMRTALRQDVWSHPHACSHTSPPSLPPRLAVPAAVQPGAVQGQPREPQAAFPAPHSHEQRAGGKVLLLLPLRRHAHSAAHRHAAGEGRGGVLVKGRAGRRGRAGHQNENRNEGYEPWTWSEVPGYPEPWTWSEVPG